MAEARPEKGEGESRIEESLEDGELDCSLRNIDRVWASASKMQTPTEKRTARRELMDSLGLITPGIFDIGQKTEDRDRKRRLEEDRIYQEKVRADQRIMQQQYSAMNDELVQLMKDRDDQIEANRRITMGLREGTEQLSRDKNYIASQLAEQQRLLAMQKGEENSVRKRMEQERMILEKDREEAKKSRSLRDQYEIEVN